MNPNSQLRLAWIAAGYSIKVYGGVDNLTNVDPPQVPGAIGTGNDVLFDPIGRMWKLGVRYKQ